MENRYSCNFDSCLEVKIIKADDNFNPNSLLKKHMSEDKVSNKSNIDDILKNDLNFKLEYICLYTFIIETSSGVQKKYFYGSLSDKLITDFHKIEECEYEQLEHIENFNEKIYDIDNNIIKQEDMIKKVSDLFNIEVSTYTYKCTLIPIYYTSYTKNDFAVNIFITPSSNDCYYNIPRDKNIDIKIENAKFIYSAQSAIYFITITIGTLYIFIDRFSGYKFFTQLAFLFISYVLFHLSCYVWFGNLEYKKNIFKKIELYYQTNGIEATKKFWISWIIILSTIAYIILFHWLVLAL